MSRVCCPKCRRWLAVEPGTVKIRCRCGLNVRILPPIEKHSPGSAVGLGVFFGVLAGLVLGVVAGLLWNASIPSQPGGALHMGGLDASGPFIRLGCTTLGAMLLGLIIGPIAGGVYADIRARSLRDAAGRFGSRKDRRSDGSEKMDGLP